MLIFVHESNKSSEMNKRKLKILQIAIGLCVSMLFLGQVLGSAEAAAVIDNIEAIDWDEIKIEDICTEAGGSCLIDEEHSAYGISLAD